MRRDELIKDSGSKGKYYYLSSSLSGKEGRWIFGLNKFKKELMLINLSIC